MRSRRTQTAKKIRVGRQPICSERRARLIDPVWVDGPVPKHFWEDKENRRNYLLWLGYRRLGFRRMHDWYRLRHEDIRQNRGAGLAQSYWRASAIVGVKECFPRYDWKDWLFAVAPRAFWKNRDNHRRYMEWLGEQLGFRRPEDWYQCQSRGFLRPQGRDVADVLRQHRFGRGDEQSSGARLQGVAV